MRTSPLEDELKILKEENSSITSKLKRVALYCQDLKQEKETLTRKLTEKEEEVKLYKEKIAILEKRLENSSDNYDTQKDYPNIDNNSHPVDNMTALNRRNSINTGLNNKASRLRYSLTNASALLSNNNNLVFDPKNSNININNINSNNYNPSNNTKSKHDYSNPTMTQVNIIAVQSKKQDSQITQLLKRLREDIEDKNKQILVLNDENTYLRMKYEEEKAKELINYDFVLSKISKHNIDNEFIKSSKELATIKSKHMYSEQRNEDLMREKEELFINIKQLEDLITEYKQQLNISKKLGISDNNNSNKNDISNKNSNVLVKKTLQEIHSSDYYKILNYYRQQSTTLEHILKELRRVKFFQDKTNEDNDLLNEEIVVLRNQITEIESIKEKQEIQIKGNSSELEYLREKNKQMKEMIDELQLSKKTYNVTYYYLGLANDAKLVFEKYEEEYLFKVITKTTTKKLNLIDYEAFQSGVDCLKLRSSVDGTEENYYLNELQSFLEDFDLFKKKCIENTKFKSQGSKIIAEKNSKEMKDLKNKEKKLMDVFGF